jgi:SH3 domain protein
VNGEVRLNVRRGAGNEFEILGGVSSNDPVTVLGTQGDWNQIRLADGQEGWIPEGYLTTEPPAQIRLTDLETEAGLLREDLEKTTAQAERLTRENHALSEQVTSLTEESSRAGRRAWFVGVIVLVFGVLLGAILRGDPRSRRSSRLRF